MKPTSGGAPPVQLSPEEATELLQYCLGDVFSQTAQVCADNENTVFPSATTPCLISHPLAFR
jgi:hypothetical protein